LAGAPFRASTPSRKTSAQPRPVTNATVGHWRQVLIYRPDSERPGRRWSPRRAASQAPFVRPRRRGTLRA
jgi:hypothetical protein